MFSLALLIINLVFKSLILAMVSAMTRMSVGLDRVLYEIA